MTSPQEEYDGALPPVLDIVRRWLRALYVHQDTPAAVALMHPHAHLPTSDYGAAVRAKYPWLGDPGVAFLEPREIGPDLDAVDVLLDEQLAARILVMRKVHPTTDEPDDPLVFHILTPGEGEPTT